MIIPIANSFPIGVAVFADASIQIIPLQGLLNGAVIDQNEGVSGIFDTDGFSLQKGIDDPMKYEYHVNYPYKSMELLKEWLVQQNILLPTKM